MSDAQKLAALDALDDDSRLAYHRLATGVEADERRLPEECTEADREVIGEIIKRARGAEKLAIETFHEIAEPWKAKIDVQRGLWKPLAERAEALYKKAQGLVDKLLAAEEERRKREEAEARQKVAEAQRIQAEAEARALAAETPEEQRAASAEADTAWKTTKGAVAQLDKAPATTSVRVGPATVYRSENLDFEITDVGSFAKAHPELVEIKRGPTLKALRDATRTLTELPESLAGWPGVRLKIRKATSSR